MQLFIREIKLEQNSLFIQFDGIFATKSWQQKSVISTLMMFHSCLTRFDIHNSVNRIHEIFFKWEWISDYTISFLTWMENVLIFSYPIFEASELPNLWSPNAQKSFWSQRWRKWRKSPKSANTSKLAKLRKMPKFQIH